MEKRNTILSMVSIVFIFCAIYMGTDSLVLGMTGSAITSEEESELINEYADQNNNLDEITITTDTTTIILPKKKISPEEKLKSYNDELNIAESDEAEITTAEFAVFVTNDEKNHKTSIDSVDLNKGCLVKEKSQNFGGQWEFLNNNNSYIDNTINISLKIESTVNIDTNCMSNLVLKILNDPRGWSTIINKEFQFTNFEKNDFEIIIATPNTVDELCAPLATNGIYSCRRENKVVLNYFRWLAGAKDFGTDLATYRLYLVNHEVGHMLGWGHTSCPAQGALAPLMMQQSRSTNGCRPYGWPTYERLSNVFDIQK